MIKMQDKLSSDFFNWLVDLRRWFHRFPEMAYNEKKTSAKICEVLDTFDVPYQSGVGGTGVLARLRAKRTGPVLALRADMDALPLNEANDVPYKSQHNGLMHACGHDGHMTIALGVIKWLIETDWQTRGSGEILFIFQPAEEGGAGAKAMLETGIFDLEPIDAVFAGHLHPERPAGDVGIAAEISNAAADTVLIRLKGKGGHGAHPHQCKDPIVVGAHLVTQLQTLISRELSPLDSAVLTIGRFEAGSASNIIPEEAYMEGTLRTFRPEVRTHIIKRLEALVEGVAKSYDVRLFLEIIKGYPVLVNDSKLVKHTKRCASEVLGAGHVHTDLPRMGAEDFAYFCQKWPGVMVGIGCHDPHMGFQYGLHSCHFDFDERTLDVATRLFGCVLTRYIENRVALHET
jgi:amidohydrolase